MGNEIQEKLAILFIYLFIVLPTVHRTLMCLHWNDQRTEANDTTSDNGYGEALCQTLSGKRKGYEF
jgi:hypothetical protein